MIDDDHLGILYEGDHARYFTRQELPGLKFANILKEIVLDFIKSRS